VVLPLVVYQIIGAMLVAAVVKRVPVLTVFTG
jgi:hypothetical protein